MTTLAEATELDLQIAWLKRRRERGDQQLTRSAAVEVRHVCYYAAQQLLQFCNDVVRPGVMPGHVVIEIKDVITDLQGLVEYVETGKGGGFSALRDRNR